MKILAPNRNILSRNIIKRLIPIIKLQWYLRKTTVSPQHSSRNPDIQIPDYRFAKQVLSNDKLNCRQLTQ